MYAAPGGHAHIFCRFPYLRNGLFIWLESRLVKIGVCHTWQACTDYLNSYISATACLYGLESRLVTISVCRIWQTQHGFCRYLYLRNGVFIWVGVPYGDNRCLPHPADMHRFCKCLYLRNGLYLLGSRLVTVGVCRTRRTCTESSNSCISVTHLYGMWSCLVTIDVCRTWQNMHGFSKHPYLRNCLFIWVGVSSGDSRCLLHPAGMHRFCTYPYPRNSLFIWVGVPSDDNRCLPYPAGMHRFCKSPQQRVYMGCLYI